MSDDFPDPYRHAKEKADALAASISPSPLIAGLDALTRDMAQIKADLKTVLSELGEIRKALKHLVS